MPTFSPIKCFRELGILHEKSFNLKTISQGDFGHFRENNLINLSKVANIALKIVFKLKLFPYKIPSSLKHLIGLNVGTLKVNRFERTPETRIPKPETRNPKPETQDIQMRDHTFWSAYIESSRGRICVQRTHT